MTAFRSKGHSPPSGVIALSGITFREGLPGASARAYPLQYQSYSFNPKMFDLLSIKAINRNMGSVLIAGYHTGIPNAGAKSVHDSDHTLSFAGGESSSQRNSDSVIPSIEFFFHSFGAQQTAYSRVWLFHSRLLRAAMSVSRR